MKVEIKANNALGEIHRNLSIPVVEIGQRLASLMLQRIWLGEAADGRHFSELGAHSKERPGNGLFWVAPTRPQPPGYVVKAANGPFTGWAGYKSYKAYTEALGSPPRTFKLTGQMLQSMRVRPMGPGKVKIAFYGPHKKAKSQPGVAAGGGANSSIAFLASRFERDPMLMPSLAEIKVARDMMREHFEEIVAAASAQAQKPGKAKPGQGKSRRRSRV